MSVLSFASGLAAWAWSNPGASAALVVGDAVAVSSLVLRLIPPDTANPTLVRVRRAAEWVALNARPTLLAVEQAIEAARKPIPATEQPK